MTTVYLSDRQCFVCGVKSRHPVGNISFGNVSPRDLDGRPTHILRSSVYLWIQRCPSCGYCAPEIAEGNEVDKTIVREDAYSRQLRDTRFPETANAFLCHGLIMRNRRQFPDAAWAHVFASWICDDNGFVESAFECRGRAIDLFSEAIGRGMDFADSREQEKLYIIDLYRRRSQFDLASKLCDEELERQHPDRILDLLYFERELIDNKDSSAHSDSEADDA